jgi:hypothetical protein
LWFYFWSALGVALFLGICGWPSYFDDRKGKVSSRRIGETIRSVIWDALIHLVGFLLVPTLLLFALVISEAPNSAEKIILGVLFLPLFFYMLFCVSGRGVNILSQTIKTGIKSVDVTWHGIKIEFGPK